MNQHEGTIVKSTNIIAGFGLTFPAWWPSLEVINSAAALLVSILSAVWLLLQIRKALRDKGEKA
ncbi:hypothetical protein [Phaeovulum sp. W22_SRMD_FR3]|uniref:hypothetical protein n=1 Tax=Phaeovulum sp. W22_SRMD_FR3 TaxID=3240274 RepID=UPI003F9D26E0